MLHKVTLTRSYTLLYRTSFTTRDHNDSLPSVYEIGLLFFSSLFATLINSRRNNSNEKRPNRHAPLFNLTHERTKENCITGHWQLFACHQQQHKQVCPRGNLLRLSVQTQCNAYFVQLLTQPYNCSATHSTCHPKQVFSLFFSPISLFSVSLVT